MELDVLEKVDILVDEGIFSSKEDLTKEAIRTLLRSRPEYLRRISARLYERGEVSLSRASELAGMDIESFKNFLAEMGLPH